jgi:hypothetical protein
MAEMTLRIKTSRLLQAAIGLVHLCNLLTPLVPAKYKGPIEAVAVLANFAVNEMSHRSNPDGTPAPALTRGADGELIAGKPL